MKDKLRNYTYYIIIGIITLITLLVLPFFGSTIGMGVQLPKGTAEWIVYMTTRVLVSIVNVLLFDAFIKQAKINISSNPNYIKANEILLTIKKSKEDTPRSPKQFFRHEYGKKGTTIFLSSAISVFCLTQAVLSYDYISAITYATTIIFGIIFGIMEMKKVEIYWTEEYYRYALGVENDNFYNDNNDISFDRKGLMEV